jgi:hypothetical protein
VPAPPAGAWYERVAVVLILGAGCSSTKGEVLDEGDRAAAVDRAPGREAPAAFGGVRAAPGWSTATRSSGRAMPIDEPVAAAPERHAELAPRDNGSALGRVTPNPRAAVARLARIRVFP